MSQYFLQMIATQQCATAISGHNKLCVKKNNNKMRTKTEKGPLYL